MTETAKTVDITQTLDIAIMNTPSMNNPSMNTPKKTNSELVEIYMDQLEPIQRKALDIAKNHLGTSFNISKSNGFVEWKKKNKY